MKRKYAALAIALSASMAISPVVSVSAASYTTGTAPEMVNETVEKDTTKPVAQFNINGTLTDIEHEGHYNILPSLKFHDNVALDSYTLNGHKNPTSIKGNQWGDGNLQNIQNSFKIGNGEDGKNELQVTDTTGNRENYTFYLDQTEPTIVNIDVTPGNGTMAPSKTVILTADEAIQSPGDGWSPAGIEGKVWKKTFTKNHKENITVTDLAGNVSEPKKFEVKRVESRAPEAKVSYSNNDEWTNQDVTVTLTANIECKTPDGWKRVGSSKKKFTKVFTKNTTEEITLVSTADVSAETPVIIKVDKIDKEAPTAKHNINPSNGQMSTEKTVTITANEAVTPEGDGWTEVENSEGKQWKKVYKKSQKDSVTITDRAGNTSSLNYEVKRIESETLSANVTYSNNGEATNQDVTVTIHTNLECRVPAGWEAVPGSAKRNAFQKVFTKNTTENVTLTSLAGQSYTQKISVTNIRQEVTANFYDEENNRQAAEVTISVPKNKEIPDTVDLSSVQDAIPQDYVYAGTETEFTIHDGYIYVPVKLTKETKEVGVNFWDNILNEQAGEGTMTVPYYAESVNAADLQLPEGYEFDGAEETLAINDGWVWADVRKSDVTVGINYWDIENNVQVTEGEITVSGYDTSVSTGSLQIPEGYELASTGDLTIMDGWLYVELRPAEKPQELKDAILKISFTDAFGTPIEGVDPITLTKNGASGEYAHFIYGEDWTLPEGYIFESENDESYAKQDFTIKYGETVDTVVIAIKEGTKAVVQITFTDPFGNPIDGVGPIELKKTGAEGEYALFQYEKDWTLPEGYTFASFNDEQIAKQDIAVKYGETLDTFTVALIPAEAE